MHLNAGKRRTVQYGLLNDTTVKDFIALAVIEPYIFQHPQTGEPTISQDRHWQIFQPTEKRQDGHTRHAFRAAVWVNRRCQASSIPVESYDIVAVLIKLQERNLVVMACYEARNGESEAEREADLADRLQAIDIATKRAQDKIGDEPLDVILCTDFNRHHVLWGGHQARRTAYRQNEGDQIVDYMQTARLHSLLPAGTITWEHQSGDLATTVDVILGSERIKDDLEYCRVYDNDYGSDHKPIALSFSGFTPRESPRMRKRLYKNADWEKIREVIGRKLGDGRYMKAITDTATLDRIAGILVNEINGVLEEHVSRAKESPYAKRWWSKELSILRADFTVKRNRITTLRRRDEDTTQAREIASAARRTYLDEIDRQKKQH